MEAPYQMASQQIQFYQYRPDSDARHNAVFTPMPTEQPVYSSPMTPYPMVHYPAPPQYWPAPPHFVRGHYMTPRVMTPTASPPLTLAMPMPKIVIDRNGQLEHGHYLESSHSPSPPTPCLSACPSTASSPPASSVYQTPVHGHGYFSIPAETYKQEVHSQTIPLMDEWSENGE